MTDFGDIRSLLHQAPSAQAWRALCTEISTWPVDSDELTDVILPYGESHLEKWPDALRRMPSEWNNALMRGHTEAPWFRWVRRLEVLSSRFRIKETRHLVGCRDLKNLTQLSINAQLSQTAFGLLAQAPYLTRIEDLSLRMAGLEDVLFARLITAPLFRRGLKGLDLGWSGISERGVRAVATSADMGSLERLVLEGCRDLRPTGSWTALVKGDALPSLEELDVSKIWLTTAHLDLLREGNVLERLTRLNLSYNEIGDDWLAKLFDGADLTKMRDLNLWNTSLGGGIAETFATRDPIPNIRTLGLGNNRLESKHLVRLLDGSTTDALEEISVRSNTLGDDPGELTALPHIPTLKRVNLWSNHLNDEGARALAESLFLQSVTELNLRHNYLGVTGCEALLAGGQLSNLKTLDLSVNRLDSAAVNVLARTTALPNLSTLRMLQNKLTPTDVMRIRENPHLPTDLKIEI